MKLLQVSKICANALPNDMDRFDRIYRLHGLLTNRRTPIPLTEIMDNLECSKATAFRCIEELRNYLNAPLDYDRKRGGYFYNQQLPP